jgi:tetratricopeptide (TPR) repeat protein
MDPNASAASDPGAALKAAVRHHQGGDLAPAAELYRAVLDHHPRQADALHLLGVLCHQQGKSEEGIDLIRQAIAVNLQVADFHLNAGNILRALARLEEAAESFGCAARLRPDDPGVRFNLALTLQDLGRREEAESEYRRVIAQAPELPEPHLNLGVILKEQGKLEEAETRLCRAIEINPDLAEAHSNLGVVRIERGQLEEAEESCRRALALRPGFAEAHLNLGNVLYRKGDMAGAGEAYGAAIGHKPAYSTAYSNRSWTNLLIGRFAEGFRDYLFRPTLDRRLSPFPEAPLPEDLNGRQLTVLLDQGIGDEIFFLRFAEKLKQRGATITYIATQKIVSLLKRVPCLDRVVPFDDMAPILDQATPPLSVGDLPFLSGAKERADIPSPLAISPLPNRLSEMRSRLADLGPAPRIGIAWRAGITQKGRLFKETPMARIAEALREIPASVVVLQRHPKEGEVAAFAEALGRPVADFTELNDDLEGMLALVALLDDYVGVSCTNVHLRAASGGKGRVLLPFPPEFRWMAEGEESPWFPGYTLYREGTSDQGAGHTWDDAFERLSRDLAGDI